MPHATSPRSAADHVAYAGKAFLCAAMARLVAEEGLHSRRRHRRRAARRPRRRVPTRPARLHGNNKSDDELDAALRVGVGRIVADSFDELDRLERARAALGAAPTVLVRTTPGVEAHTHEYIETGTEDSKFGFTVSDGIAFDAVRHVVTSPVLRFGGLHCHIGSQIQRLDPWGHAVPVLAAARGVATSSTRRSTELSLGGGLGARYLAEDPPLDIDGLRGRAAGRGRPITGRPRAAPRLRCSSSRAGRSWRRARSPSTGSGTVKEIPGVGTYVAVDGGMSDNPRPVLYGAGYEAYLPGRVAEDRPLRCRVVGKHCEQGDVIVADAALPDGVPPRRPPRHPDDGRLRLLDGVELQQGASPRGGVPPRTASPGRGAAARDRRRPGPASTWWETEWRCEDPVRVGLLGCGNVGSALARLLDEHADRIAARAGVGHRGDSRVAVRDVGRDRET